MTSAWKTERNCKICEKGFIPNSPNALICSKQCKRRYHVLKNKEYKERDYIPRSGNCVICSSSFIIPKNSSALCCSKECSAEKTRLRHAEYRKDPVYKEKMRKHDEKHRNSEKKKAWREKNRARLSKKNVEYCKERKATDKAFHMALSIRSCVGRMVRHNRDFSSKETINYTPEELKSHLESQFRDGMSWDNYGRLGWHIDHKKPLTAFNFFDENGNVNMEELRECMSLDNLQPLWYDENIRKGGLRRMRTTLDERKATK